MCEQCEEVYKELPLMDTVDRATLPGGSASYPATVARPSRPSRLALVAAECLYIGSAALLGQVIGSAIGRVLFH